MQKMQKMQKMQFNITTLSTLIVSPRSSQAFYVESAQKDKKMEVIYPFYQYGEYETYEPQNAAYYLPGSSIKGSLSAGIPQKDPEHAALSMMVDDIPIQNQWIICKELFKAQYVDVPVRTKFDVFFENVGVEMLKSEIQLTGELYVKEKATAETVLEQANESTRFKIGQMLEYLQALITKEQKDVFLSEVSEIIQNLSSLKDCRHVLLLGGYKGLLHSLQLQPNFLERNQGFGVYLDSHKKLPHGLIRFEWV